jgi:hypothetical protein
MTSSERLILLSIECCRGPLTQQTGPQTVMPRRQAHVLEATDDDRRLLRGQIVSDDIMAPDVKVRLLQMGEEPGINVCHDEHGPLVSFPTRTVTVCAYTLAHR